jgi:hypothetical protein
MVACTGRPRFEYINIGPTMPGTWSKYALNRSDSATMPKRAASSGCLSGTYEAGAEARDCLFVSWMKNSQRVEARRDSRCDGCRSIPDVGDLVISFRLTRIYLSRVSFAPNIAVSQSQLRHAMMVPVAGSPHENTSSA